MELKAGYKQTDAGVIPEDWDVKLLVELTTEISDGIHTTPEYVQSSAFFFINGNNLIDGKIGRDSAIGCYLYILFIYATRGVAKWEKEVQSLDS